MPSKSDIFFYVWSAYGAAAIILLGLTIASLLRHLRLKKEEEKRK